MRTGLSASQLRARIGTTSSCTADTLVVQALNRARAFYSWGAPHDDRFEQPTSDGNPAVALTRALQLILEDNERGVDLLNKAQEFFVQEEHPSGAFKAVLYKMIWFERQGDVDRLSQLFFEGTDVLGKYNAKQREGDSQ